MISFRTILVVSLLLISMACKSQSGDTNAVKPGPASTVPAVQPAAKNPQNKINVPLLANKSAAELDAAFGKPAKISPATNPREIPGEYRQYNIAGNEKGLSIRFYKDRAVRFNLFVEPVESAKSALLLNFAIDVKTQTGDTKTEPLSEKYKGRFNDVNFVTAYAKKDKAGGRFVMVHAEVAQ